MFHDWKSAVAAFALMATPALAAQDTLTLGMVLEPPSLDPTGNAAAAIDEVVYANIFEGLTKFGPDGSIQPALASSWDVADDGKTYIFHLHEGVKFHDGADFTAEDAVFSLDRARAPDSTNAQKTLFENIDTTTAVDPKTLKVTLKAPDGMFPFKMAWGDAVMLDPASIATEATKPIGTGPFKMTSYEPKVGVKLEAYPE